MAFHRDRTCVEGDGRLKGFGSALLRKEMKQPRILVMKRKEKRDTVLCSILCKGG